MSIDVKKLKNTYNNFEEITNKINEIIDKAGGGGGGSFEPTQPQLDAMNSGATAQKINKIAENTVQIQNLDSNKVSKEVGKQLIPDAELAQITLNKTDLTLLKKPIEKSGNPTDSDVVSSINSNAQNDTWTFGKIWNWLVSKLTKTITSAATNLMIPSAKAVWDLFNSLTTGRLTILTSAITSGTDYSHFAKNGKVVTVSIGFSSSAQLSKNEEIYRLPYNLGNNETEIYCVVSTISGSTRVLQCGGSKGGNVIFAKADMPAGYYFGSFSYNILS